MPAQVQPVSAVVPMGLRVASEVAWRSVAVLIGLAIIAYVLMQVSSVAIPVAVALLITALLGPVVGVLSNRLRFPRYLAAALALVFGIVVVVAALVLAGGQMVSGFSELGQQVSVGVTQIQNWLSTGPLQIGGDQISEAITQGRQWLSSNASSLTSGAMAVGSSATNFIAGLVIALVVTLFLLGDGANIWGWCVRLLPAETRRPVHNAFRRGWVTLGSYVRTQMLVAAIDAVGIALGAMLLGLPLVVPLGLIVFFASFVPMVGAILSGALAVVLALVVKGPLTALLMLGVVLLVQQIESNVLQPILMSKSVSLHPLATLLGVAIGSFLLGIVGAVFAVPLMAVTNTVMLYLKGHDQFPALGETPVPGGDRVTAEQAPLPPAERVSGEVTNGGDAHDATDAKAAAAPAATGEAPHDDADESTSVTRDY
ncbi:MAG: AI-2E family transporter [Dermatophilus congolensis]|nr:AI-2E family transporter [Dermatophilus congolensis]